MLLGASELPSIRRFAYDLWQALEESELVVLASPDTPHAKRWRQAILQALVDVIQKEGDHPPCFVPPMRGDLAEPVCELSKSLDLPSETSVAELLECVVRDPICVVTVCCESQLSAGWKAFFREAARVYRSCGLDFRQRPVLVVLVGCSEYPPVETTIGIRIRALWNPIRWEEIRLLTEAELPKDENALVHAWRVAVYSAVSGGDPGTISRLCSEIPNSLTESIECSIGNLRTLGNISRQTVPIFVPDQQWTVPANAVAPWAVGHIVGISLERGTIYSLAHLDRSQVEEYLRYAIWREQVSGLLPIIMEIGLLTNEAVTNEIGTTWTNRGLRTDGAWQTELYLEPREVMERIKINAGRRVSAMLWVSLGLLRDTRNDLAHMRAVDYARVTELWTRYDRVRRKVANNRP